MNAMAEGRLQTVRAAVTYDIRKLNLPKDILFGRTGEKAIARMASILSGNF